jgi:adhesin/invasin
MQSAIASFRARCLHTVGLVALLLGLAYGCGGGDLECGGPFCVPPPGPQVATRLRAGHGDGQTGVPGGELLQPVEVIVTDDEAHPVPGVAVTFTVTEGDGSLSAATVQTDIHGLAPVRWTLGPEAGTQTLQATATGTSGADLSGSPLSFTARAIVPLAASLAIRQPPPDTVRNGIVFERQPVVVVLDADERPVVGAEVTASIASGGGTLGGAVTVATDVEGRASYTDLAVVGMAGPRVLRFQLADPALEVATGTIQLEAGAPSRLDPAGPLTYQASVSSPVSPAPSVVVHDAADNVVAGVPVVFTADGDASVSPVAAVVTDPSGVAQVASWTLGKAADVQYKLTARIQSSSIEAVVFSAIAHAGAAGRLDITVQPPPATQSGVVFAPQPEVRVVDQAGNPVPQAGVTIAATIASGPSGRLQNASAATDASGLASFSGLSLTGLAGAYTLSFSAPSLGGVTSQSVALAAGPPAQLALATAPPAVARSRVPLSTQPSIQLQDASGNPLSQAGIAVKASIASGGGALGGQASVLTNSSGRADFTDLTIIGVPGRRTLRFASQSPFSEVISRQITLPSVASISVNSSLPTSAVVGTPLAGPASWTLLDADGLTVADAPATLSASGGGSVAPASTTSDPSGTVQLTSWTLGHTAGTQSVDLDVAGAGSSSIEIEATPDAAARLLKVSGDSQSAPVDSELPVPLVVRVVDQYGNGVSGVTVEWRTCEGVGDYDAVTDAGGYASAFQSTGPDAGTFCGMASSSGLADSPVQFTYTALAASGTMTPEGSSSRLRARPPSDRRR